MGRMERIEPCGKRRPYVIDYALIPEPDSDRRLLVGLDSCGHVWVSLTDALRNRTAVVLLQGVHDRTQVRPLDLQSRHRAGNRFGRERTGAQPRRLGRACRRRRPFQFPAV